jgi:hypothetical protein
MSTFGPLAGTTSVATALEQVHCESTAPSNTSEQNRNGRETFITNRFRYIFALLPAGKASCESNTAILPSQRKILILQDVDVLPQASKWRPKFSSAVGFLLPRGTFL